jgi:hypothetical protein
MLQRGSGHLRRFVLERLYALDTPQVLEASR